MAKEQTSKELAKFQSNLPTTSEDDKESNLISDEVLLGVYGEILNNLRTDRDQVDEFINNFSEAVINGGDSATSSKEALVNLVKIKVETADKLAKIADLMTRLKMKQPDTYKPYLGRKDNGGHTINIYDQTGMNKRAMLDALKGNKNDNT